jgi:hypothetical protein
VLQAFGVVPPAFFLDYSTPALEAQGAPALHPGALAPAGRCWRGQVPRAIPYGTFVNDDLLASTGMADAATLAARFGYDIRKVDFWRASLAIVRADIDRFEVLVG